MQMKEDDLAESSVLSLTLGRNISGSKDITDRKLIIIHIIALCKNNT